MIGYIYKIARKSDKKTVYIGSTFKVLKYRFSEHKCEYKRFLNGKCHYYSSFEIVKYEDAEINLIEEVEVKDKTELRQIEDDFMTIYDDIGFNVVNKNRAISTEEQYKENSKERSRKYRQQKNICECGGKFLRTHIKDHEKTIKH